MAGNVMVHEAMAGGASQLQQLGAPRAEGGARGLRGGPVSFQIGGVASSSDSDDDVAPTNGSRGQGVLRGHRKTNKQRMLERGVSVRAGPGGQLRVRKTTVLKSTLRHHASLLAKGSGLQLLDLSQNTVG